MGSRRLLSVLALVAMTLSSMRAMAQLQWNRFGDLAEPRNFSGYELAAMDRHAEWMGQTLERQLLSTRETD